MTSVKITTHELAKKWLSEPDKLVLVYDNEYGPDLAAVVDDFYVKLSPGGTEVHLIQATPAEGFQMAVALR